MVRNIRFGVGLGSNLELEDSLWAGLTDSYCKLPMALTAENLADKYKISRDEVEEYALRSQGNWKKGNLFYHNMNLLFNILVFNLQCAQNLYYSIYEYLLLLISLYAYIAHDSGYFKAEIAPVSVKVKGKEVAIDTDEHPKPASTKESIGKLPSIFKKGGTVTAATASVS
jgi:acetyl-CoA acyltransferase 2